jgi:hypothetical protein
MHGVLVEVGLMEGELGGEEVAGWEEGEEVGDQEA